MNNTDFLEEMERFVEKEYNEFKIYQEITVDIFEEFKRVCSKGCIDYQIIFGTLLGAIRDENVIPWDYDIDTIIRIDDKDKLLTSLDSYLRDDYYYTYDNKTKDYLAPCLRVCKKGYPSTAIHVDVFFLIGCPNNENEAMDFIKKVKKKVDLKIKKYSPKWFDKGAETSTLKNMIKVYRKLRSSIIPKFLFNNIDSYCRKYSLKDSCYCYIVGQNPLTICETKWFSETLECNFGGTQGNVPLMYDEILKTYYGDYMSYPPISERYMEYAELLKITRSRIKIYQDNPM